MTITMIRYPITNGSEPILTSLMVFITNYLITDPELECHFRRQEYKIFVSGKNHPCANQHNITLEELLQYPFVVTEPTGHCYNSLLQLAANDGLNLKYDIMVNDLSAIAIFLESSNYVSFIPECSLERYGSLYGLVRLDVAVPEQIYYSQVLVRKNKWISPALEYMISILKTQISGGDSRIE